MKRIRGKFPDVFLIYKISKDMCKTNQSIQPVSHKFAFCDDPLQCIHANFKQSAINQTIGAQRLRMFLFAITTPLCVNVWIIHQHNFMGVFLFSDVYLDRRIVVASKSVNQNYLLPRLIRIFLNSLH